MAAYVWRWFFAAAAATLVLGVAYVLLQQDYRESLNDPQVQLAEDAARSLSKGGVPADLVVRGAPLIDIAQSLSPWVAIYDSRGVALESSGQLSGAPPKLPQGVFDTTTWLSHQNGRYYNQSPVKQTRFTWQPEPDVRQAVVLAQTADGRYFVAGGRNMREGEQRIEHLGELVFLGWLATLVILAMLQWLYVLGTGAARHRPR